MMVLGVYLEKNRKFLQEQIYWEMKECGKRHVNLCWENEAIDFRIRFNIRLDILQ